MAVVEDLEGEEDAPKKKSKLPLLIGLVLALAGGGGGFYAVYSGMILAPAPTGGAHGDTHAEEAHVEELPAIGFVPVEPLVISLGRHAQNRHLRFRAQLEVADGYQEDVTLLMPRILDVLNSYLRAVEVSELEDPSSLPRLRAQMLRRVQIVTGEGRIRDLLVTEFVLN